MSGEPSTSPKVALAVVASKAEAGWDRAGQLKDDAHNNLDRVGIDIVTPEHVILTETDARIAGRNLSDEDADLLIILNCTWVADSIQYQLLNTIGVPVLLWAVPYPETYSLASIEHFRSILCENGDWSSWVYGLPSDEELAQKIYDVSNACRVYQQVKSSAVGLVGPRYTWRLTGPQDTTLDEWNLFKKLGISVVHIEFDEFLGRLEELSLEEVSEAEAVLKKRDYGWRGTVDRSRLEHSLRVYLATKALIQELDLIGMAVECYPNYPGLVNLASSWLADEGVILDPEGDVGHTFLGRVMLDIEPGPIALAEPILLDASGNRLIVRHEGSSAQSLADEEFETIIVPVGNEVGAIVGFPMKEVPVLTIADLIGRANRFRLYTIEGKTLKLSHKEWESYGGGFVAALQFDAGYDVIFKKALDMGMDHHWIMKDGAISNKLKIIGTLLGMEVKPLD
jgi:hypothetical protein